MINYKRMFKKMGYFVYQSRMRLSNLENITLQSYYIHLFWKTLVSFSTTTMGIPLIYEAVKLTVKIDGFCETQKAPTLDARYHDWCGGLKIDNNGDVRSFFLS